MHEGQKSNGFRRNWSMHIGLRHHQPVPNQYGEVGHGSKVGKSVAWQWGDGGAYFGVLAQTLLGRNVLLE